MSEIVATNEIRKAAAEAYRKRREDQEAAERKRIHDDWMAQRCQTADLLEAMLGVDAHDCTDPDDGSAALMVDGLLFKADNPFAEGWVLQVQIRCSTCSKPLWYAFDTPATLGKALSEPTICCECSQPKGRIRGNDTPAKRLLDALQDYIQAVQS